MAVLKQETVLIFYIFTNPVLWKFLTRSDKCFLVECLSWIAMIPYNEAKRLITAAVFEHDAIVYVKGHEKRM